MPNPTLMRGAIPTPRNILAAAMPHMPVPGAPVNHIRLPAKLSPGAWGNFQYGDCVTAEEAFAKACYSPEIFIEDAHATQWANKNGWLNGANLGEVLKRMQYDGFEQDGYTYDVGAIFSVDWTNAAALQSAIALGPVKTGVASDQLSKARDANKDNSGWFGVGFTAEDKQDHCVSLCGYGTLTWLAQQLKVSVPSGVDGTKPGYAVYTWDSIGILDVPSLLAITHEAWLRTPTTVPKVVLSDASPKAPSIAMLNNQLFLAWKGEGSEDLNVMCSGDGGHTFAGKYTGHDSSSQTPALCAHNGALYIAWKGSGNDNLNVARVTTSGNTVTGLANKVVLGDQSPYGPALASCNGNLYLAWKGDSNDQLNLLVSSNNGASFGNKYISPESSSQAPALCSSGNVLHIAWKGSGNDNLSVARVNVAGAAITGFANKVTLGEKSPGAPALAAVGTRVYLAWRGDGNDNLNVERSSDEGVSFGNKVVLGETSPQPPALAILNGSVFCAWKGDSNDQLNVASLAI